METSIEQKHLRASSSTIDTTDLESRLENLNRELESNPCESPAIQCEREILENILEINKCLLYISVVHISIYAVISKDKLNHYSKILTSMVETHYIQMQKLKDEYTATYNKLSEVINSCIDHVISTAEAYRMNPEDFILKNIVSDFVSSAPFEQTQYDQLWENGDYEGLIAYIKDVFEQHDKILLKVRHLPYCLQQLSNFRDQYMGDFNLRSQLKLHELHASLFELEDLKDKIYISQVSNHSYYINKFNELLEMVKLRAKFLNQLTLGLGTAMAYIDIQFNPIKLEIFEAKKPVASLLKDNYSTGILDSGHKKFVRDLKTEFVKYDQGIDIILKKINFGIKNYRSIALVSMLNAIKASLLQVMYADLHQEYTGTFSDLHDILITRVESQTNCNPEYKQELTNLINQIEQLNQVITDSSFAKRLLLDIDTLIADGTEIPTQEKYDIFKDKFLARLHSQDDLMLVQDKHWHERTTTIALAVMTLGLALAASYAYTKLTTGSAYLFWETTKKQENVENIAKLVETNLSIPTIN